MKIGEIVDNFKVPPHPSNIILEGKLVRLEPLNADKHSVQLFESNAMDKEKINWTYLPYGPFETIEIYTDWIKEFEKGNFSMKSEVDIRLFLIEYVKCIDAIKVEEIMYKFDKSYNGKSHNKTLTFVPTSNNKADSSKGFNTDTILNSENYTPKKIALIIFTFLIIMLVFWAVGFLSLQS